MKHLGGSGNGQRVRMIGRQPPPGPAGHRVLARRHQLRPGQDGTLVHGLPHVGLGPAGRGEQPGVLGAQHQGGADRLVDERPGPRDRAGQVGGQLLGHHGVPGLDVHARPDHHRGHRAVGRGQAELLVQGRPRALLLVLRDARGVLGRRALGGLVELVRAQAERVDRTEPDGPPDGGVGPEARAENVPRAVQAEPLAHRPVDDQERGGPGSGLPDGPADVPLGDQRLPHWPRCTSLNRRSRPPRSRSCAGSAGSGSPRPGGRSSPS